MIFIEPMHASSTEKQIVTQQCAYCEVSLDTLGKKFKDPEKRLIGFRVLRYDV